MKNRISKKAGLSLIALVVVLVGCLVAYLNKQNIEDWWALLGYKPPSKIVTLANQDGMSAYTRKVFYVNHPVIEPTTTFSSVCPDNSDQMVVLGCYHAPQKGIYLLNVNEPELYGLVQVTAAYETLHAIYQRLSPSAVKVLNSELLAYENHGLNNATIKAQIANFRVTEPGDVLNEMTSLFGTEVENLPPALNAFYSHYFNNRQILLDYYNDYQAAFTSRENMIKSDDSQLSSLDLQIKSDESELNTEIGVIDNEQTALDSERSAGEIDEYNAAVPGYNQQVSTYNGLVGSLKGLVNQYNSIVASRNALALEEQQLVHDITASPVPISSK